MQVTKTVRNVPLLHGHGHKVVNATGRSRRRWRFAPDCITCQSNAASNRQRFAPSPNKHGTASYPTLCSQKGWGLGCWEVADWQRWKTEPFAAVTRSHGPCGPVGALSCWKMKKSPELHGYWTASPGFSSMSWTYSTFTFDARVCEYEMGKNSLFFVSK